MSILNLLQGLASAAPNSHEINELINAQPKKIRDVINDNNNDALKNMISSNQFYANETKVTLY